MQLELPLPLAARTADEHQPSLPRLGWQDLVAASLGPAVMGAILAWPDGWASALTRAALVPLVLAGVLVAMAPALFVGRVLSERSLAGEDALAAGLAALTEMGKVALGFAPLVSLLSLDSPLWHPTRVAVLVSIALAMCAGYLSLFRNLFARTSMLSRVLFGAWALIGSATALRLIDLG